MNSPLNYTDYLGLELAEIQWLINDDVSVDYDTGKETFRENQYCRLHSKTTKIVVATKDSYVKRPAMEFLSTVANGLSGLGGFQFKLAKQVGGAGDVLNIVMPILFNNEPAEHVTKVGLRSYIEEGNWVPSKPGAVLCAIQNRYQYRTYWTPGFLENNKNYYIPYFDELPSGSLNDLPHWQNYMFKDPTKIYVTEIKHTLNIWTCSIDEYQQDSNSYEGIGIEDYEAPAP